MKPRILSIPIAALSLGLAASGVRAEIVVGVAGPMSGSFAVFGEQMTAGAKQAIADINADGGLLGEKLVLEVADDECDRKQAESVANQMVGRGIALMVGHFCSGPAIIASPIYNDAGIVEISPGARDPKYTDERPGPGIFRIGGRDDEQGKVAGAYLAEHFADARIAIVHDTSPYGQSLADATRRAMNDAGKLETFFEGYPADERDFSPLLARVEAERIDVVFFGGYHTEAALVLRRLKEDGKAITLVSGDAILTGEFMTVAGDAGVGTLMTYPPDPARNESAADVVKRLAARGIIAEGYVLYAYAAVETWAAAVRSAGTIDFAPVVEALANGEFATVLGTFSFDEKGDATLPGFVVYEWRDDGYDYAPM